MAPRTRSNRVELLAKEKLLASGHTFNTQGFPALPDELYLEIISNLPALPVPTEDMRANAKDLRNRQLTLFSLSQTCRSLRRVFLKYLWQRIEVYECMETGKGPLPPLSEASEKPRFANYVYKQYAEELVRQLEIVTIRDPDQAKHVNILNVLIADHSVKAILAELVRCIALFPNLHTVQLVFMFNPYRNYGVLELFKAHKFPQIRNVCVIEESEAFLFSCPNACRVTPYMNISFGYLLLNRTIEACPQVQALGAFDFNSFTRERLLKHLKHLCDITLDPVSLRQGYEFIQPLSQLRRLHTIRIRLSINLKMNKLRPYPRPYPRAGPRATIMEETEWVLWARKILLACPKSETGDEKKILVYRHDGTVTTFRLSA